MARSRIARGVSISDERSGIATNAAGAAGDIMPEAMRITPEVRKYIQSITRKGGQAKTPAKVAASRRNGKMGGRPREFPKCKRYRSHHFVKRADGSVRCPCGFKRPADSD